MMSVLPLISPEKGTQLGFVAQGTLLVVSGVYYPVEVLPQWMQCDREDLARDVRARRHPRGDPRGPGPHRDVGRAVAADHHRRRLDPARPLGLLARRAVREEAREAEEERLSERAAGREPESRSSQSAYVLARPGGCVASMSEHAVLVDHLEKVFDVPERDPGLVAATKGLVRRKTREVRAVDAISFDGRPGRGRRLPRAERRRQDDDAQDAFRAALPDRRGGARARASCRRSGSASFLSRITLVMGNRNQLQWDLPALDSFELNRAIYRIPREEFAPLRDELIELLEIGDLVRKPVRQLSLGERMKAEIVGRAPAPAAGPLPRRADDRARRDDAEADPRVRRRLQRALRRDRAAHEPLHGRRRGALQARHRHPPRHGSSTTAPLPGSPTSSPPTRRSASRSRTGRPTSRATGRSSTATATGSRSACRRPRRRA